MTDTSRHSAKMFCLFVSKEDDLRLHTDGVEMPSDEKVVTLHPSLKTNFLLVMNSDN